MDKSISELSIFTMLGGRASVIDLHLKSLAKHTSKSTKKICLLPPNHRTKTLALCSKYGDDFEFVSREKFGFHLKPTPDVNYDRLFKEKCITSKFIFIHDDTILLSPLENYLKKKFVDYDFVGAIDNAVKPGQFNQYSKILFDKKSMADIRIGTWFLAGDSNIYRRNKLSVGEASRLFPVWSNLLFQTLRLRIRGLSAYSDGGFNFNIKARKLGLSINTVDPNGDDVAVHFSRLAAGFHNRGLGQFVDTPSEIDIWHQRLSDFIKTNDWDNYKKDMNFLTGIYEHLKEHDVYDDLICAENLDVFAKLKPQA